LRDKDAQKLITLWKFRSIYIYSTRSNPTTETTHGICEEAQQEAAQGREEASEAPGEEARQEKESSTSQKTLTVLSVK
jgi:hypothetical protein